MLRQPANQRHDVSRQFPFRTNRAHDWSRKIENATRAFLVFDRELSAILAGVRRLCRATASLLDRVETAATNRRLLFRQVSRSYSNPPASRTDREKRQHGTSSNPSISQISRELRSLLLLQ